MGIEDELLLVLSAISMKSKARKSFKNQETHNDWVQKLCIHNI